MRRKLTAAAVVAAFLSLCLSAGEALDAARGALVLCADTILPSLFPFFVLSILFSRLGIPRALGRRLGGVAGRLFGVSGVGIAALPIGLLGGYPMGAACMEALEQADGDPQHQGAQPAVCDTLPHGDRPEKRQHTAKQRRKAEGEILGIQEEMSKFDLPTQSSVKKQIQIFSVPVFFSRSRGGASGRKRGADGLRLRGMLFGAARSDGAVGRARPARARHAGAAGAVLRLFRDRQRSAVGALRGLSPSPAHLALAAAILGWGGLSVHCQTAALFCESPVSLRSHTLGRLCSALLSAGIAWALASLL